MASQAYYMAIFNRQIDRSNNGNFRLGKQSGGGVAQDDIRATVGKAGVSSRPTGVNDRQNLPPGARSSCAGLKPLTPRERRRCPEDTAV